VESDLQVGDLVIPTHVTQPNFMERHGFGVIIEIEHSDVKGVKPIFVVKFTRSRQVIRFAPDGVKKHE
jgi:hypothetical protein